MAKKTAFSNNYYWIDIEDAAETARLISQDRLIYDYLGGLLPKTVTLPQDGHILDVGCGAGTWALDIAFTYPTVDVIGIDLSSTLIQYALAFAHVRALHNVAFQMMDATMPLAFKSASFDFIHTRFMATSLLPDAWNACLQECTRILDTNGILCLTEAEWPLTNSFAFETLSALVSRALWLTGRSFSPDGHHLCITPMLGSSLRQKGYQDIQSQINSLSFFPGTEAYAMCFHNYRVLFKLLQPFLQKMGVITLAEFDSLYDQMLSEIQSDDFCGLITLLSVYGRKN